MQKLIKKIDKYISDNLVYIFWGIYIFTLLLNNVSVFSYGNIIIVLKLIRYICYIIFLLKIFKDWKNGSKITGVMIILFALFLLNAIFSQNKNLLFVLLVLIAIKNLDVNKLIKITFKIFSVTFFVVISLSLVNVLPDWIFYRGNIERHALGFIYTTTPIGIYLIIILMYFYIKKANAKVIEILALEMINIFLYDYTDGRTSFILITCILGVLLISKIKFVKTIFSSKIINTILKISCYCLPIFLFCLSNALVFLYAQNNEYIVELDELLSKRLYYTNSAYQEYGITLLGDNIEWQGWAGYGYTDSGEVNNYEYNYVDNAYARIIFDCGIIGSVLILFGYTITLISNFKNKNYWVVITIEFALIWFLMEPYIVDIGRNTLVLFLTPLLEKYPIEKLNYNNLKALKNRLEKVKN